MHEIWPDMIALSGLFGFDSRQYLHFVQWMHEKHWKTFEFLHDVKSSEQKSATFYCLSYPKYEMMRIKQQLYSRDIEFSMHFMQTTMHCDISWSIAKTLHAHTHTQNDVSSVLHEMYLLSFCWSTTKYLCIWYLFSFFTLPPTCHYLWISSCYRHKMMILSWKNPIWEIIIVCFSVLFFFMRFSSIQFFFFFFKFACGMNHIKINSAVAISSSQQTT